MQMNRTESLPSRPVREPLREIVVFSLGWMFLVLWISSIENQTFNFDAFVRLAPVAGLAILQHIGWGFGVYVPVLLGFYVVVIGRQLAADKAKEHETRRELGLVATALAGALVPALFFVVVACIKDPMKAGALIVVVPASLLVFFLAIKLGSFGVVEEELRLKNAMSSREWAKGRLKALRVRSRKPLTAVLFVNALTGVIGGFAVVYFAVGISPEFAAIGILYLLAALGLAYVGMNWHYSLRTATGKSDKITGWLLAGMVYVAVVSVAIVALGSSIPQAGVGLFVLMAVLFLATLAPIREASPILVNWTLRGSAAREAASWIARKHRRNVLEIMELGPETGDNNRPTLRERIGNLLKK